MQSLIRRGLAQVANLRIRTRLLLLMVLFATAVLINILALVFLARALSAPLDDIEQIRVRQLLAAQMNEKLRNAESALNRYYSEGASGYAAAFDFQLDSFGDSVDAYQRVALSDDERSWASELSLLRSDVRELGHNLIRVRGEQTRSLQQMIAAQAQFASLLAALNAQRGADNASRDALDGMNQEAQRLLLTVTAYLATPDERTRQQFDGSAQRFQAWSATLRRIDSSAPGASAADQTDAAFGALHELGVQLISARDFQVAWFTPFSADIFQGGQRVIAGQIEPLEAQRLSDAKANVEGAVRAALLAGLGVPLALTLLAALSVLRLARQMDQNMQSLLRGAGRVAAGQLDEPVRVTTRDELMDLSETFNHMMADLAAREHGLKARVAELETLHAVSLQITSTLDRERVLDSIAGSVLHLVQATHVHIYTRTEADGALQLAAGAGEHRPPPTPRLAPPDSLAALAAGSGNLQIVSPGEGLDRREAGAAFPLKLGEQVLGVLYISSEGRPAFSGEDVRILSLLADQAAVALGNARLYRELAEREERVRALMQKLAQIQDEERRLIGLDLHDGLTQLVISAHMHLNTLEAILPASTDGHTRRELATSRTLVKRAIEEARRVIAELRPTVVEEFGLAEGLRHYVTDVSLAEGWQSETQIALNGLALTPAAETAIFRIAQEAIANARKYAGSPSIRVELKRAGGDLLLSVQDEGCGFDLTALSDEREQLGLVSMSERAKMLGGRCEICTAPGRGTLVTVRAPLAVLQASHA